jgi:beta-lactamase class A
MMKATILLFAGLLMTLSAEAQVHQDSVLSEVRRLEREYGGHLGVMAKNLRTGEVVQYNAQERFPTASLIKLPVMVAYYQMVHEGKLDPASTITLSAADKKPGSGVLLRLGNGATISLQDAVDLMITLSDNTATNLVLDRLSSTHAGRLAQVNDFMARLGLKNTRILNRLYSWDTKQRTPEAIRYGIGVSTPEDMVVLLEAMYRRHLVDSTASDDMMRVLKGQFYDDVLPRLLPASECKEFAVAHKSGFVDEINTDAGLVLSDKLNMAIAVFVDKQPDRDEGINNRGKLLAAHVSRAFWNYFTGDQGYAPGRVNAAAVNWNVLPGGRWGIWRSPAAPFPHPLRADGFTRSDGTRYPYFPHYSDSSIVVFVPNRLTEGDRGVNMIVYFHGHLNDNVGVLEQHLLPQAMLDENINGILVIPQGPYRARDSFGGRMEDTGGLKLLVEDVLATMKREGVIKAPAVHNLVIAAHSGGYRPAAYCIDRGGMNDHITHLFLFDAFYGNLEFFRAWLTSGSGIIEAAYTEHLKEEHVGFAAGLDPLTVSRFHVQPSTVEHGEVPQAYMRPWLHTLPNEWKLELAH